MQHCPVCAVGWLYHCGRCGNTGCKNENCSNCGWKVRGGSGCLKCGSRYDIKEAIAPARARATYPTVIAGRFPHPDLKIRVPISRSAVPLRPHPPGKFCKHAINQSAYSGKIDQF